MADEQDRIRRQREEEERIARERRMAELKAERERKAEEAARARAESDPMRNPTVRPEAPQTDPDAIQYYGWIGGAGSGRWKLYKVDKETATTAQINTAEARSEGGQTQATFTSAVGANTVVQPTPPSTPTGTQTDAERQAAIDKAIKESMDRVNASIAAAGAGKQTTVNTSVATVLPTLIDTRVTTTPTTSVTPATTVKPSVTITGSQYLGSGANRILRTSYSDGTYTDTSAPDITNTGVVTQDSATLQLLQSLQQQNAAIMAQMAASQKQAQIDAKAAAEAVAKEKQQSALAILTDRFNRYGLASLVPKIRELVISGANEDTIALQLQETDEYKQRFKANQERLKKGLAVLSPGDYIGIEDSYRQILRAYGLKQFDTDEYVSQFIANDVSTAELSSRVATAVQRVQNADPAITKTLRDFYGIGTTDLVAYVLDPNQQFQKIERQVAAAEIGTAARRQGLEAGVNVAEQLAAQGITQAEAQRGYATIADILPQAGKLSAIYTDVLDQYGQAEAEQEVFNSLASAQRKRRALIEREAAAFAGQTGLGRTSLSQQTGGLI